MRWGPGFNLFLAALRDISLAGKAAPSAVGDLFHLRVSLLPSANGPAPSLPPTPVPTPAARD